MSCRVLHRGVEEKLLAKIAAEAEEQSLEQVVRNGFSNRNG